MQCVFHVCPWRCISVTSEARSQWLILSSGGCLAHWEEGSQNWRWAPVTGLPDQGSRQTRSQYTTHMHRNVHTYPGPVLTCAGTCRTTFLHTNTVTQIHWGYLSIPAGLPCISILLSTVVLTYFLSLTRSVRPLFTLGFPDMISMKTCSSGHALPVVPAPSLLKLLSHGDTVRSPANWIEPYHVWLSIVGERTHFSPVERHPSQQPNAGCFIK